MLGCLKLWFMLFQKGPWWLSHWSAPPPMVARSRENAARGFFLAFDDEGNTRPSAAPDCSWVAAAKNSAAA